jgi:AcrR family transcriptional regulator
LADRPGARERIVLAAIEILERDGAAGITTRRIASEAGVNSAAVNYYFGSKDELIRRVMEITLTHGFTDWVEVFRDETVACPVRLYAVLFLMLEGIEHNPGLVRAHLFEDGTRDWSRKEFTRMLSTFLDEAARVLSPGTGMPAADLKPALGRLMMSVLSVGLIPEMLPVMAPGGREEFLLGLVRSIPGMRLELNLETRAQIEAIRARAFSSFDGQ